FQVNNADGREFFRNAGRTRHRGIEVATSLRVSPALHVTTSYTYSHFIFQDDGLAAAQYEGNRLPGVPPHHLLMRATARVPPIAIEPELEWTSSYFADDANTVRNSGFAVLNLRISGSHPVAGLTPFAAVNNLGNARYNSSVVINAAGNRYFEPAPGVNFYIGLTARRGHGGLSQ
ncbi:MAG TPA: TonB-dependent receptor, partial [Longimicrobiales bacterium]